MWMCTLSGDCLYNTFWVGEGELSGTPNVYVVSGKSRTRTQGCIEVIPSPPSLPGELGALRCKIVHTVFLHQLPQDQLLAMTAWPSPTPGHSDKILAFPPRGADEPGTLLAAGERLPIKEHL